MSGVVLRCPNCGTTRTSPGECAACHEAQVRYFCANHSPGRWLDAAACPECGARFGEPARPRPTGGAATPAAAPAAARPRSAGTPPPVDPDSERWGRGGSPPGARRPGAGPGAEAGGLGASPRRGPPPDERAPTIEDLFEAFGARPAPRGAPPEAIVEPPARRRRGMGLGGCLMRLVMLAFVMLAMLVSGLFLFGGSLIRLFGPY